MKKGKILSKLLTGLFRLLTALYLIFLIFLATSLYFSLISNIKVLFLAVMASSIIWMSVALVLLESGGLIKEYENVVEWRKKDIKWMSDGILAIDKLLSLPDNELRQKIGDIGIAKMTINGTDHRFNVSTHLFLIEDIRESLWSRKMSLTEELSQKRTIPEEPRIVAFWRKSLAFLLEKQQTIEANSI